MKRQVANGVALFFILASASAHAGDIALLKQKLVDARSALFTMLENVDKRDAAQQKLVKDTANAVSAVLADMKSPAGKEALFKELVATWKAFKKTREEELVPRILERKQLEAEHIATGIQNERFLKMINLCEELEK